MLLFDLFDYIIFLIIRLLPILITIISVFIAYYFYKLNNITINNNMTDENKNSDQQSIEEFKNNNIEEINKLCINKPYLCDMSIYKKYLTKPKKYKSDNYFCGRGCYFKDNKDNKECIFNLNKDVNFKCPEIMCTNKNICKDKNIESFTNNSEKFENYYCFQNDKCIAKKKNFMKPSKNTCCSPNISQYPNKIYSSLDKCYQDNLAYKKFSKNKCLSFSHGYGYIDGYGCIKGTPHGPNNIFLDYGIYSDKSNYTVSNPNPHINYNYKNNKYIYSHHL